ncbi:MAG: AraC family transcriptional regulator [Lachnospiraceae bacterium]|nr:AraC family transcriptional regulator [Lachnospiraceae bacterium]
MNTNYVSLTVHPDYSAHMDQTIGNLPIFFAREILSGNHLNKIPPHWNRELELILVQTGSIKIIGNGIQHQMNEGDIAIIDAGCFHYFENTSGSDTFYYIGLLNEAVFSANRNLTDRFVNPIFHCFTPGLTHLPVTSPFNSRLRTIFQELYRIINEKEEAYELLVTAKCYEILTILCNIQKYAFLKQDNVDTKTSVALKSMLDHILAHVSGKISIEDLCEAGNISRNTCFQFFHDFMGDTPSNFILRYRLNHAMTLLTDSSLSISEIADHCGFSQQSHFTQHFSKTFGITPLQFRKSQQKSSR